MTTVSIVIPTYNHYDLLHQCLYDVFRHCKGVNEVVVVNDYSTDEEVITGLAWWKGTGILPIREIRTAENRGFLRASNIGLKKATGDVKILLSNDVRLHADIISSILTILKEDKNRLIGGVIYTHDTGWNTFGKKTFPYVEGWLLATGASAWEKLDYFDERYSPNDYEDVDLSTTALHMKMGLAAIPQGQAIHAGGLSIGYNDKREALTRRNQKRFEEKWVTRKSKS